MQSIEDYLKIFVSLADERGILTRERLREALETSLTANELQQLFALVKDRQPHKQGIDYTGLVATLFER